MKKLVHIVLVIIVLSLTLVNTAFAGPGDPAGSCAPGFEFHHFMDHEGDPMHTHIGVNADLNGDGYICVKPLSPTTHLHIDNSLPLW